MNLVLFEPAELGVPLPVADPRAQHILKVLRRAPGDSFVAGVVDGPLGTATLHSVDAASVSFAFAPTVEPPPLPPIALIVGLPRPQTARDLLRDATTLGVSCIHFIVTERADPNYAASTLWTSGEWRRHCLAGAAQAFATRLPLVTSDQSLATALAALPAGTTQRLALDNYEAATALSTQVLLRDNPVVLAFGPERGWGPADRAALRAHGFTLVHLGSRVLRSETAVIAATTLVRAKLCLL